MSNLKRVKTVYEEIDGESRIIRLVRLQAGRFEDPIHCSLALADLDDEPEYEALSYTWGDANDTLPIFLNGFLFEVTLNLEAALRHLRPKPGEEPRTLWIDAISINQENLPERGHQVGLMMSIFNNASQVNMWVGDEKVVQGWHKKRNGSDSRGYSVWNDMITHITAIHHYDHLSQMSEFEIDHLIESLEVLISFPFWFRVWIVQEIVTAFRAVIHYGREQDSWHNLQKTAMLLSRHAESCCSWVFKQGDPARQTIVRRFIHIVQRISGYNQLWNADAELLPLLWQNTDRSASDPRDLIYALLGMAEYEDQPVIDPDYTLALADINRLLVVRMIQSMNSLSPLWGSYRHVLGRTDTRLQPSWIPDYAARLSLEEAHRIQHTEIFNASLGETPEFKYVNKTAIAMTGIKFDAVLAAVECSDLTEDLKGGIQKLVDLIRTQKPGSKSGSTAWRSALVKTLCYELLPVVKKPSDLRKSTFGRNIRLQVQRNWLTFAPSVVWTKWELFQDHASIIKSWDRWIDAEIIRGEDEEMAPEDKANLARIVRSIGLATPQRSFFITKKGHFGLGPPDVKQGDQVYILAGSAVPFVLRETGEKRFDGLGKVRCNSLIGDAYCHGIMSGEAFDRARLKKVFLV